ncbi:MAG: response regulator [Anaerolineae bacterium]|nr:response regulator [Anaerolineae bacterium]MDW8173862.1 response regulator [Anaerolineae bacterium]
MTQLISGTTQRREDYPESLADGHEEREPHLRSTRHDLRLVSLQGLSISETGYVRVLNLSAEGQDATEGQDAKRSSDETQTEAEAEAQVAAQPVPQPSSDPAPIVPPSLDKSKPVLVVEDTQDIAEIIQATIEGMGLKTVYAGSGKQGLDVMREQTPQIIMLDIGLPDITGWRMLDHIKEHYAEAQLAMPTVIVITAYGDPANKLIGKLQNVYSYLVKPVLPDQVERVVKMVINGETPSGAAGLL